MDLLKDAVGLMPKGLGTRTEYYMSAYSEALSIKTRGGAPLSKYSIDRRQLYKYTKCLQDDGDCSLI